MDPDETLQSIYLDYKNEAMHLGDLHRKFKLKGEAIQPVNFVTFIKIFDRVYDRL